MVNSRHCEEARRADEATEDAMSKGVPNSTEFGQSLDGANSMIDRWVRFVLEFSIQKGV